jgi:hypothetical protein
MMKFFSNEDEARDYMRSLNHSHRQELFCMVDGPEDNFAIVDLETAIGIEMPYEWSTR